MLSKLKELRKELSSHKKLQPLWDDARPMIEANIQLLERKCSRRTESPLKAFGNDFEGGGGEVFGYNHWGTIVNYVYAKPTGKDEMSVQFYLERAPTAGATLRLVARGDGAPKQIRIQAILNDLPLVDGVSPFRHDQFETRNFNIPSANLRAGPNKLVIRNIEPEGALGDRPHFIVSEAELLLNRSKDD